MSGTDTFAEHYVNLAYGRSLMIDAAQKDSRIAVNVDAEFNFGEPGQSFTAENIGNSSASAMGDRFGELPDGQIEQRRRVGHFKPFEDGKILDSNYDKARRIVMDPASSKMEAMRRGLRRRQDIEAMTAILGTAYSGATGTTSSSLPAAQKIAVNDHTFNSGGSGDVPLTFSKLQLAMERLDAAEIDGERYIACPARQINHLLTSDKVTSADYQNIKALVHGEIDTLLRFKFIRYEDVLVDGSSDKRIAAWVKPAVQFKQRTLEAPSMWKRTDKRPHWYGYYAVEMAGVRREDVGVVEIACHPV